VLRPCRRSTIVVAASTAGRLAARILGEKFEYVISAEPRGRFKGWVEEVDSCTELRFRYGGG
jgi:hypothetical protein